MHLLYVEDEIDILEITARRLVQDGFVVDTCTDGQAAWALLDQNAYDAIILDILLPEVDGLTLLAQLRERGCRTPVLMLTALDGVSDRIRGLEDGADDYLVKPFAYAELLARVRALLRRQPGPSTAASSPDPALPEGGTAAGSGSRLASQILTLADLVLNLDAWTVMRSGQPIALSQKEFIMLAYLLRHQGQILSREQIEHHVWTSDFEGGSNVVDVYIRYLRRKIDAVFSPPLIHTVRGVGYVLKVKDLPGRPVLPVAAKTEAAATESSDQESVDPATGGRANLPAAAAANPGP